SVPNRRFLRRNGGLSLVHHCLERVNPQHMTTGALRQTCRLTDRLGSWSEEWADSAIEALLGPSRLWVFAPLEAQLSLAGVLRGLARRCPERMRRVVGLQRCLDALDLHYWYTPPPCGSGSGSSSTGAAPSPSNPDNTDTGGGGGGDSTRNDNPLQGSWSHMSVEWVHPMTGQVLGQKASGPGLMEVRARILDAAALMARDGENGIRRAEVAAVIGHLERCRDDSSRRETLQLLLRLADTPRRAARFA
ncbi:unnamed protein product, partial [Discosporangium mesarthrocarpum]